VLELGKFRARRWAQWEDGTLDLGFRGTTFVRGINYDKGGNPNGAGKSTIFYGLSPVLFGEHVLSVRKNSLGTVSRDTTRLDLYGKRDGRPFDLHLKGTSLEVNMDGKPRDVREKGAARKLVEREIVRMSPELWSSMVHCVGIAGNPLIRGTSAQRCQFIERAFDLDRWAAKYAKVGDVLSGMRRAASDLDDARKELESLPAPRDTDAMREELSDLQSRRDRYRARLKELRELSSRFGNLPDKPERSAAFYAKKEADLEQQISRLSKNGELHARWSVAKKRHEEAEEERRNLESRVEKLSRELPRDYDAARAEERVRSLSTKLELAESYEAAQPAIRRWKKLASSVAERHGIEYRNLEELRALSRSWCSALKAGGSRCPVCGSKFRREVDAADIRALSELVEELPDSVRPPEDADVPKLKRRLATAREHLRIAGKLADLRDRLRRVPSVDVPERVDHDPDAASKLARKLAAARELKRRAESWREVPADFDPAESAKELAKLEDRLDKVVNKVASLSEESARAEEQRRARRVVKRRVDDLSAEVELHPVYRGLQAAYSPSGMRLWLLSEMLEAIVSSLNSSIESTRERVSYGYKLARNRDLSLTASNLSGTFDVRMLSGGEAGVFVINLAMAILPLLPDSKRVSTLILDEVDANASSQTRKIIANEFLPKLSEVVPSLWVVTPTLRQEFRVSGARELLVEKRGAVSRLAGA
jgi:DNA repair exonuclease SbcCD ATPase subunit